MEEKYVSRKSTFEENYFRGKVFSRKSTFEEKYFRGKVFSRKSTFEEKNVSRKSTCRGKRLPPYRYRADVNRVGISHECLHVALASVR